MPPPNPPPSPAGPRDRTSAPARAGDARAATADNPAPQRPAVGLDVPVQFLRGVGPRRATQFAALGIHTLEDLLAHLPMRYEEVGALTPIALVQAGRPVTLAGEVTDLEFRPGRLQRFDVVLRDATGWAIVTWFHGRFAAAKVRKGDRLRVQGKAELSDGKVRLVNPKMDILPPGVEPARGGGLVPVYPAGAGLESRHISAAVGNALGAVRTWVRDPVPPARREARDLPPLADAIRFIHRPASIAQVDLARRRLAYDELFVLEAGVALRKRKITLGNARPVIVNPAVDARIRARFPFTLTPEQDRVVAEISADLARNRPMNRLLQGDVGSGKTVVALYAALAAIAGGCQAAIMAPTEILAEQHLRNSERWLAGSRVRLRALSGGLPAAVRRERLRALADGEIDLVIGTQALLEPDVAFDRLAVVVIDEGHKFGVLQRRDFRHKGLDPHYLVMTATPIPRTLGLTLFGDLEVSVIRGRPPGRQPVKTRLVVPDQEPETIAFLRRRLAAGEKAFVVCPLVEDNPDLELRSATGEAERLAGMLPGVKVDLLHGRMTGDQKDEVMRGFAAGATQVLVSTVVIEVGVDVPDATVMAVRHAERFGLSQLHQLRGRVGRGGREGWCLLFCEAEGEGGDGRRRLEALVDTDDGFRIAEEDLRIRGPGEFFGTRQHGMPELRVADLVRDTDLVEAARTDAFAVVEADPALKLPEHAELRRRLIKSLAGVMELISVG